MKSFLCCAVFINFVLLALIEGGKPFVGLKTSFANSFFFFNTSVFAFLTRGQILHVYKLALYKEPTVLLIYTSEGSCPVRLPCVQLDI